MYLSVHLRYWMNETRPLLVKIRDYQPMGLPMALLGYYCLSIYNRVRQFALA